jgi:hypothetical protein
VRLWPPPTETPAIGERGGSDDAARESKNLMNPFRQIILIYIAFLIYYCVLGFVIFHSQKPTDRPVHANHLDCLPAFRSDLPCLPMDEIEKMMLESVDSREQKI